MFGRVMSRTGVIVIIRLHQSRVALQGTSRNLEASVRAAQRHEVELMDAKDAALAGSRAKRGAACSYHRSHSERHGGRSRTLPRRGNGRLHQQAHVQG